MNEYQPCNEDKNCNAPQMTDEAGRKHCTKHFLSQDAFEKLQAALDREYAPSKPCAKCAEHERNL
jgi:hypothetical protein